KKHDTEEAIALLNQGADANATDKAYQPMTLESMWLDFCNRMKGKKPAVDAKQYAPALLLPYWSKYWPFPDDNPALVKALLEHGANPYAMDEDGLTVLHDACMFLHPKTMKVLLEHHINPDVRDIEWATPLMSAVWMPMKDNTECVRMLL